MKLAAKTYKELFNNLNKALEENLKRAAELIQQIIHAHIEEYYNEYEPEKYERTKQFLHSCVTSEVYKKGKNFCIDIYIDYNHMYYKISNPWQVVDWANRGMHGGYDNEQLGISQPFSHFWDDAMDEIIIDKTLVIEEFIKWLEEKTGSKVEAR